MPDFIERDPTTIAAEVKADFEAALGKTIFPGQPEQLLVNVAAYRELQVRLGVQYAAEQTLVNFATGDRLNELGAFTGVERLQPSKARTVLRFKRVNLTSALLIPAGFRVAAPGNQLWFETDIDLTIPAGNDQGDVSAEALETGEGYNGFKAGAINQLVDAPPVGVTLSVVNVTPSAGGSAVETDDRLRRRIKLSPNKFSVAGSKGAYEFFTLSADASITDVAALNGGNVQVNVYPLVTSGLPSPAILSLVQSVLDANTVRPLTDVVRVFSPVERRFDIRADITLYAGVLAAEVALAAQAAAASYAEGLRGQLGTDVIRSQIVAALSLSGVYSVEVVSPAKDLVLAENEWANAQTVITTAVGTANG